MNERLEYCVKREELKELDHICFYGDTRAYPRRFVLGSANSGSESCIFGIPPGKVPIGSAGLGRGGREGQS